MQQNNPNLDLICLNLIELAHEAAQLKNRSSQTALRRLLAIDREYIRRIEQEQQHAQEMGEATNEKQP